MTVCLLLNCSENRKSAEGGQGEEKSRGNRGRIGYTSGNRS
jgi:hypothetical protein